MHLTKTIRLNGSVPRNESLEFVEANVFTKPEIPFAIVRYKLYGTLHAEGLRLDLDKQVFLDHLEETSQEAIAESAAPAIVRYLYHLETAGRRTAHS